MVGAEATPFASSGGLGDVLGSLPIEIKKAAGCEADVRVVLPLYSGIPAEYKRKMKKEADFYLDLAWRRQYCGIKSLEVKGVKYYFIDNEYYFMRGSTEIRRRRAVCLLLQSLARDDGGDGLSPTYFTRTTGRRRFRWLPETDYRSDPRYSRILSVYNHNIEYQGKYGHENLWDVFEFTPAEKSVLDNAGCINLMKGAIALADKVTTVSPRYAEEIKSSEYAHGLEFILRMNSYKLSGILNGIDYAVYNPETDKNIKSNYSARNIAAKYPNKTALQEELALPVREDVPMVCSVTRLVGHKGFDLMRDTLYPLLSQRDIQFVILGTGEPAIEDFFRGVEYHFSDKARSIIKFDRALSFRIYAACDIFLMPSKSEPCGLAQMIASRYGAIPVVRETGGLFDSIKGYYRRTVIFTATALPLRTTAQMSLPRESAPLLICGRTPKKEKNL